ncbi:MAG: hypothetical protein N2043_01605 [Ignavibacterium sp.]|nr:hypothetical protein [Ignavibacterium sp.]
MRIVLSGQSKVELVKRCIDLEKRGWVCIKPIQKVYNIKSHFKIKHCRNNKYFSFNGINSFNKYYAVYEKED